MGPRTVLVVNYLPKSKLSRWPMERTFHDFPVKLRGKRKNSLFARSFHGRANFSLPSKLLWKHKSHFSPEKGDGKSECEIPTRKRGGHFAQKAEWVLRRIKT